MGQPQPIRGALRPEAAVSAPERQTWCERNPWLLALVLLVVSFVVYQPVWQAGFIWDDDDHLTSNPAMTAPHGLQMIWSSLAVSRYYPLTLTSFWVQRRLWGLNPMPYHLVNIALHAINGILIFFALRRLRVRAACWAALLWVFHPVQVESVAWVSELKNIQSGFFFFLTLLCFLRFEEHGERRWYALALVCGLAAMLSKPSTVVLPLVLLLCAWWERRHWQRADIIRIVPFFGLALGMSVLTVIEQRQYILRANTIEWTSGVAERFVIAGRAVWFYAAKLLWPTGLMFVYPRWDIHANTVLAWLPLAGLVAVAAIMWIWRRQPWARAGLFGLGYLVAALLPVLGFFDVYYFYYSYVADHFQYLASLGVIALSAAVVSRVLGRWSTHSPTLTTGVWFTLLGTLACLTWQQARMYHDSERLFRTTILQNPGCWMAHNNLGLLLSQSGRTREAMREYEQALQIKPNLMETHINLGIALCQLGQAQEAIQHYEQVLRVKPDLAVAHNNLALALLQLGRLPEAKQHCEEALRVAPDFAEAHYNLGNVLLRLGELRGAIEHYEQVLRRKPDDANAHNNLGVALLQLGKLSEARQQFEETLRLKPDYADARSNLEALGSVSRTAHPKN